MNIRKDKGITLSALVVTIIVLLIIAGVSITGLISNSSSTKESAQIAELKTIQHALLEKNTRAQITKENLPGTNIDIVDVQKVINEINDKTGENIILKRKVNDYKLLNKKDLESLGISNEDDTYIVNYKTGEVINSSQKFTKSGKALYIYSKEDK